MKTSFGLVRAAVVGVVLAAGVYEAARADEPPAHPVVVRQNFPAGVVAGQPFTAEVHVTNTAPRPVEDVELIGHWSKSHQLSSADPPAARSLGLQTMWQLGRLSPGETRKLQLSFGPTDQPSGVEFQSNFRVGIRLETTDQKTVPIRRQALDLAVTGPQVAVVGQPVTVQFVLKNTDAAEVRGVVINSHLPDGLSHPRGADLEAEMKVVPGGQTEALPLVLTPTRAGVVRTVFRASGPGLEAVERELNLTAIDAKLDLRLHGPKTLPLNWPGTYEVTVCNAGDQAAPDVQLEVGVPAGVEDLRATNGAKYDAAGRRLLWAVGELQPGETRTLVWIGVATKPGETVIAAATGLNGVAIKKAEWRTQVQPAAAGTSGN